VLAAQHYELLTQHKILGLQPRPRHELRLDNKQPVQKRPRRSLHLPHTNLRVIPDMTFGRHSTERFRVSAARAIAGNT